MTMIEKVARALIGVDGAPIDASVEDMIPLATAAIRALMEPSEGMVEAGAHNRPWDNYAAPDDNDNARDVWQAMITAALEGEQ